MMTHAARSSIGVQALVSTHVIFRSATWAPRFDDWSPLVASWSPARGNGRHWRGSQISEREQLRYRLSGKAFEFRRNVTMRTTRHGKSRKFLVCDAQAEHV